MESNAVGGVLDCIDKNLWIGSVTAATDVEIIHRNCISHILTIDCCPLPSTITELKHVKTMFIQVTDTPGEDLISHFEETYNFIEEGVKNGAVLVHCFMGVSRSATIMIAYLMKKHKMKLQEAYDFVKSKRRIIEPNEGFMAQLQLFEVMNFTVDKSNVQYKMFRLYIASTKMRQMKVLPHSFSEVVKCDPLLMSAPPDPGVFKCRKCRRVVAVAANMLPHISNEKYSWTDKRYSDDVENGDFCDKKYFIEPLAWMENVMESSEGKLYCPNSNCRLHLGSFNWIMGCVCPCGTKVSPAFYLVPSKVDKANFVKNIQTAV